MEQISLKISVKTPIKSVCLIVSSTIQRRQLSKTEQCTNADIELKREIVDPKHVTVYLLDTLAPAAGFEITMSFQLAYVQIYT